MIKYFVKKLYFQIGAWEWGFELFVFLTKIPGKNFIHTFQCPILNILDTIFDSTYFTWTRTTLVIDWIRTIRTGLQKTIFDLFKIKCIEISWIVRLIWMQFRIIELNEKCKQHKIKTLFRITVEFAHSGYWIMCSLSKD